MLWTFGMQVARREPPGFGTGAIAPANRLSAREIRGAAAGARARKWAPTEAPPGGGSRRLGLYAKPSCGNGVETPEPCRMVGPQAAPAAFGNGFRPARTQEWTALKSRNNANALASTAGGVPRAGRQASRAPRGGPQPRGGTKLACTEASPCASINA